MVLAILILLYMKFCLTVRNCLVKRKKKKDSKGLDTRRVDASPAPVGPVRLPLLLPQSSLLVGVSVNTH